MKKYTLLLLSCIAATVHAGKNQKKKPSKVAAAAAKKAEELRAQRLKWGKQSLDILGTNLNTLKEELKSLTKEAQETISITPEQEGRTLEKKISQELNRIKTLAPEEQAKAYAELSNTLQQGLTLNRRDILIKRLKQKVKFAVQEAQKQLESAKQANKTIAREVNGTIDGFMKE